MIGSDHSAREQCYDYFRREPFSVPVWAIAQISSLLLSVNESAILCNFDEIFILATLAAQCFTVEPCYILDLNSLIWISVIRRSANQNIPPLS